MERALCRKRSRVRSFCDCLLAWPYKVRDGVLRREAPARVASPNVVRSSLLSRVLLGATSRRTPCSWSLVEDVVGLVAVVVACGGDKRVFSQ